MTSTWATSGFSDIPRHWAEEFEDECSNANSICGAHLRHKVDWSVDSLKLVDGYLEELHDGFVRSSGLLGRLFRKPPLNAQQVEVVVHRTGAYVGEVIRKHYLTDHNWYPFDTWISNNPTHTEYLGQTSELSTVFILGNAAGDMCLPFSKVLKFLHNGSEDSVYFFARTMSLDNQQTEE